MLQRKRILVEGEPFSYLAAGPPDGPLVLLLHGFPDLPSTWNPIVEALAGRGLRAVAPFMRGYAPSTLRGPFDAARLGQDVLALGRILSPARPVSVVGHDWGAVATYAAAVLEPERLTRIVTLAVPHPIAFLRAVRRPAQLRRSWYMGFFQLPRLPEAALARGLATRLWRAWSPGWEPPAEHLRDLELCLAASMPAPIAYYRALARPGRRLASLAARARREPIRVPCLYLHGADDGCIGTELLDGQERWFAGPFEAEVLPRCGHFLQLERPADVAARITEWLALGTPAGVHTCRS